MGKLNPEKIRHLQGFLRIPLQRHVVLSSKPVGHRGRVFLVFLSKVFRVYSYEELATLRPRISTDRSQIAVLTPIGSPDVCTSVDSCLGHDTRHTHNPTNAAQKPTLMIQRW